MNFYLQNTEINILKAEIYKSRFLFQQYLLFLSKKHTFAQNTLIYETF